MPPKKKKTSEQVVQKKTRTKKKAAQPKSVVPKKAASKKNVSKKKPPKTPAINTAAGKRNVKISETPTVLGSHQSQPNWSGDQDGTSNLVVLQSGTQASASQPSVPEHPLPPPPPSNEQATSLSLAERLPSIDSVINKLMNHHRVHGILDAPGVFKDDEERDHFCAEYFSYDVEGSGGNSFWDDAWELMHNLIIKYTPIAASQVSKFKTAYNKAVVSHAISHFGDHVPPCYGNVGQPQRLKFRWLSAALGWCLLMYSSSLLCRQVERS